MAHQINEINLTWDSLATISEETGWRSLPISFDGECELMAARRFPNNQEALLLYFQNIDISEQSLPHGIGFSIEKIQLGNGKNWLGLTRTEFGSIDLFTKMVVDVIQTLKLNGHSPSNILVKIFLGRIRSWQNFMQKETVKLSDEAELGLVGELTVMEALLDAGVCSTVLIESWLGPQGNLQDFEIGSGAIEVKSTISPSRFIAKINSAEQLDNPNLNPIFLAAVKLKQSNDSNTLPEIIRKLTSKISNIDSSRIFTEKLLDVGYYDHFSENYTRRFKLVTLRYLEVNDHFPKILNVNIPNQISRVSYDLDVDAIQSEEINISELLKKLGVLL